MSRRKTITISVVLLSICYFLYTRPERVKRSSESLDVVTRIDAGSDRSITILKATEPFEIPAWYFEIDKGSQRLVRTCFLYGCCSGDGNPKFRLVTSRDQSVVGLIWDRQPDVLLLTYDFNAVEWRGAPGDELACERVVEHGPALIDRLQTENPQLKLRAP
jgi:hypothetical protein